MHALVTGKAASISIFLEFLSVLVLRWRRHIKKRMVWVDLLFRYYEVSSLGLGILIVGNFSPLDFAT